VLSEPSVRSFCMTVLWAKSGVYAERVHAPAAALGQVNQR
jgi:hypothetical protein